MIVDISEFPGKVLQTIEIPQKYSGPHLATIDKKTGDIYSVEVSDSPLSTVLKFTNGGNGEEKKVENEILDLEFLGHF